jgi:hypothetical protein
MTCRPIHESARLARLVIATLCGLALLLASCGGGVDSGGTGAPEAVALAAGPVTGLGSVTVNGVRFDDSAATVVDQDGNALSADQLQVGMTIRVDASAVVAAGGVQTSTALAIRASSEIIGPVDSVGPFGTTMTVLGQPVRITVATWFDLALPGGVGALTTGQIVEVWGQYNARTNEYVATRVAPRADASAFELRGLLGAADLTAQTLTIGGLTISDASIVASALPPLNIGEFLRVRLATTPLNGVWAATGIAPGNSPLPDRADLRWAGRISSLTSVTQFVINGVAVDASAAVFSDGGTGVVLGARVVVKGSASGGVVKAATVTVEGDETLANSTFEVHGAITSLNTALGTLKVRGITINYSSQVEFSGGSIGDLATGRTIDVIGTLNSNRTSIDAQTIAFY